MSTCTRWVDKVVIECKQWAQQTRKQCEEYGTRSRQECDRWADEGYSKCDRWEEQQTKTCDDWDKHCCSWWPCSWGCKLITWVCVAWKYVTTWVCKAYVWVAKWVCKAWHTIVEWFCIAWSYVLEVVCVLWSWIVKLICVAWDNLRCTLTGILNLIFRPSRRGDRRIKHVFVLMLENRSFDHMLGFSDFRGTDVITNLPTQTNNLIGGSYQNTNPADGTVFTAGTPADFKLSDDDKGPGHEFQDTLIQLTGQDVTYTPGAYPPINNSGYVANYHEIGSASPGKVMNVYSPRQIPILNTLAHEFAVCDNWYSSLPGPTWPNRFFVHAASSGGLDDSPSNFEVVTSTLFDGYRFDNGTIYDRLEDQCRNWLVFEGDETPQVFAISGMNINALQGRFRDFEDFRDSVNDPAYPAAYTFIEPNYGNIMPWTAEDYTCGSSQHPLDDVTRGEKLIKEVYETIRNSPHWESSMLIITYDEHGGFYDHTVPPTTVHPGDSITDEDNDHHHFDFRQLGPRVPAVIVSPYVKRNMIDHTLYDHSSVIKTTAEIFGFGTLTQRDRQANSFRHVLQLDTPRSDTPATLPAVPDSGFACSSILDEIIDAVGLQQVSRLYEERKQAELAASLKAERKLIDPSLRGFLHIAFMKYHALVPPDQRETLVQRFLELRTNTQAREFMTEARSYFRAYKRINPPKKPWRRSTPDTTQR